MVLERLNFENEKQCEKLLAKLSAARANERAAHKKARQVEWEEKLAKKKLQLFRQNHPGVDSD